MVTLGAGGKLEQWIHERTPVGPVSAAIIGAQGIRRQPSRLNRFPWRGLCLDRDYTTLGVWGAHRILETPTCIDAPSVVGSVVTMTQLG